MKKRIFVSSVQREFASSRKQLAAMIRGDRWLSSFFEVFLFEEECARSRSAQKIYLDAVADADIYIGIVGDEYGNADAEGVSPTEREFDRATELRKDRLVFVRKNAAKRQATEASFLKKIGNEVTWKTFTEDLYRPHDSNPRNEVIAQAMSWTSYVEKSGNGTREIIRKCVEHGLAEPVFEPRPGFFHTILWRKGYGPGGFIGGVEDRAHKTGQSRQARVVGQSCRPESVGQSRGSESIVARIASALLREDCSRSQLAQRINVSVQAGWFKAKIQSLLDDGLIERTIPDKPNSRLQRYRLTGKGRRTFAEGA